MNNLIDVLSNTGLSPKESEVYLALLKIKTGTAYKIAKISKIKKPTTYVILENLREKGFVLKTPSKRGTTYTAKSPDELVHSVEEKLSSIVQILPQLRNLFKGNQNNINVFYYEGFDGVKDLLFYKIDEINDEKMYAFFAKLESYDEKILKLTKSWALVLLKNKILLKGITPDVKITRHAIETNPGIYQEMKFVDPEKYSSNISIDCIHNFVRIIDFKNLNGIIIENTEVTKTVKQIFEMVWGSLK